MRSICKHKSNDGLCLLHSEPLYKEPCPEGPCYDYTAMTNADHIRAMSDDELAMFLDDVQKYNIVCKPIIAKDCADCMTDLCWQCWLDWLKQEVES